MRILLKTHWCWQALMWVTILLSINYYPITIIKRGYIKRGYCSFRSSLIHKMLLRGMNPFSKKPQRQEPAKGWWRRHPHPPAKATRLLFSSLLTVHSSSRTGAKIVENERAARRPSSPRLAWRWPSTKWLPETVSAYYRRSYGIIRDCEQQRFIRRGSDPVPLYILFLEKKGTAVPLFAHLD